MEIILASSSPRRRDLLSILVESFRVVVPHIDESVNDGELPACYVERLAISKAEHCMKEKTIVIAADTCVSIENEILGKPVNRDHARAMLQRLSGRKHQVYTGLAILAPAHRYAITVKTAVQFSRLDDAVIEDYLDTDEPYDKAGAYGIQGIAGSFVAAIEGSYSSVVGLPLCEAREALQKCGAMMKVVGQTGER
jgi:septum formation protein